MNARYVVTRAPLTPPPARQAPDRCNKALVEVQGVVCSEKEEAKQKNHKKVLDSAGTVRDGNQCGER
jgi:hypothetical protein